MNKNWFEHQCKQIEHKARHWSLWRLKEALEGKEPTFLCQVCNKRFNCETEGDFSTQYWLHKGCHNSNDSNLVYRLSVILLELSRLNVKVNTIHQSTYLNKDAQEGYIIFLLHKQQDHNILFIDITSTSINYILTNKAIRKEFPSTTLKIPEEFIELIK